MLTQSQSGTGKTAAFVHSMLSKVDGAKEWPQALCLAPTFELALQIGQVVEEMGKCMTDIKVGYSVRGQRVARGAKMKEQIVIGTPGTTLDWGLKWRAIDLSKIQVFVVDEADVMIATQGHQDQSIRIQKKLPKSCQMMMFSATYEESVMKFAEAMIPDPIVIRSKRDEVSDLYSVYQRKSEEEFVQWLKDVANVRRDYASMCYNGLQGCATVSSTDRPAPKPTSQGSFSIGSLLRAFSSPEKPINFNVSSPIRSLPSASITSPERQESQGCTKKYMQFIQNGMGSKDVTSLPGIGKTYGSRLHQAGYNTVSDLYSVYQTKSEGEFVQWLKDVVHVRRDYASMCYNGLQEWATLSSADRSAPKSPPKSQGSFSIGSLLIALSSGDETSPEIPMDFSVSSPIRSLPSASITSPERQESQGYTKKHMQFVQNGMGSEDVTSLPGIGKTYGARLHQVGYYTVSDLYSVYQTKSEGEFVQWLKDVVHVRRDYASMCYNGLQRWATLSSADRSAPKSPPKSQGSFSIGSLLIALSSGDETSPEIPMDFSVSSPIRSLPSASITSPERQESQGYTKKHMQFVQNGMGSEDVTSLPGIGKTYGSKLNQAGYYTVSDLFSVYRTKSQGEFVQWVKDVAHVRRDYASMCYNGLQEWATLSSTDRAVPKSQGSFSIGSLLGAFSTGDETLPEKPMDFSVSSPINVLPSASTTSTERREPQRYTKKHMQFVQNSTGSKNVTSLPGIGKTYGSRLHQAGYNTVSDLYSVYQTERKAECVQLEKDRTSSEKRESVNLSSLMSARPLADKTAPKGQESFSLRSPIGALPSADKTAPRGQGSFSASSPTRSLPSASKTSPERRESFRLSFPNVARPSAGSTAPKGQESFSTGSPISTLYSAGITSPERRESFRLSSPKVARPSAGRTTPKGQESFSTSSPISTLYSAGITSPERRESFSLSSPKVARPSVGRTAPKGQESFSTGSPISTLYSVGITSPERRESFSLSPPKGTRPSAGRTTPKGQESFSTGSPISTLYSAGITSPERRESFSLSSPKVARPSVGRTAPKGQESFSTGSPISTLYSVGITSPERRESFSLSPPKGTRPSAGRTTPKGQESFSTGLPIRALPSASITSPERRESQGCTKKYMQLIQNGMGSQDVTSLPGIGKAYGSKLNQAGYFTVSDLYRIYQTKSQGEFVQWLKDVANARRDYASMCYNGLQGWAGY